MTPRRLPIHDWILAQSEAGVGFFVEAGAHDGVGDSNSVYLERICGWAGICVEPAAAYAHLVKSRSCKTDNRCLWGKDGEVVLFRQVVHDPELSGIVGCFGDHWDRAIRPHRDIFKQTVSLTALLVEHGAPHTIDVLLLDTEGSELEILSGHDWSRYRIRLITVEHNYVESKRSAVKALLESKGYSRDERDRGVEDWYVYGGTR